MPTSSYPPGPSTRSLNAPFALDESKFHEPPARPGIVDRTALVERLHAAAPRPVLAVTAPAGYGKSTFLAQYAQRKQPRVAWLSLDNRDNDPAVLLTYLAAAMDRVEPINHFEPRVLRSLASPGAGIAAVVSLASSISAMSAPISIVLDHAEALTSRECRDMVAEFALRIPEGSQLAIGSRQQVPLPVSRLRADRSMIEVGVEQLAMSEVEAESLLRGAGVELHDDDRRALLTRTEGWPAGLYLAALAIGPGRRRVDISESFSGDDRYMGDYLRSEFLRRVSRADATFLTRTSILDRMNGALCDATVGGSGSARVLDRLERRNLLVIPLDRRADWYRYHHLFRDLLHAELLRREPETVKDLHLRAAAWFEANGMAEAALDHAQQAGDVDLVARLVLELANPLWAEGRLDTVLSWMEWFSVDDRLDEHPAVAAHGALIYALIGKAADAERWAVAADRAASGEVLTDGNTMESSLAYLNTLLCREGLDQMRVDAQVALTGLTATSPYRPAMLHAEGMTYFLAGDLGRADDLFARACDEAIAGGVVPFVPLIQASRGLVAIERDDWPEAERLAAQAMQIMNEGGFEDYWTSALVYAWAARVAVHRGEITAARDLVLHAARLRPLLTYALPIVSVQALVQLARAYLALADPAGAVTALRQINDIRQFRRELGPIMRDVDDLRSKLDLLKGEMLGASSLTTAELRVLPLLATHLSLAEISERLFVSRNTIKTQTVSIYRKLGVSTRNETIRRMVEVGLVGQA